MMMQDTMNDPVKQAKDSAYRLLFLYRTIKGNAFIFLSRIFLKNEGGLDLYLWGQAKYYLTRISCKNRKPAVAVSAPNKDVVSFLHRNKYAAVNLDLPDELIRKIRAKVDQYIEDDNFSGVRGGDQGNTREKHYTRAMKNIVKNIPEVKQVLTPELEAILQDYFGTNIGVSSVYMWRNYHVPETLENRVFYSNEWHNDNIAPTELKLFVNLTEVTEKHGPLHIISAPVSRTLFERKAYKGRKKKNDTAILESKEHVVKHTGKPGSAVLAHASCCLHRADVPAEGNYRDMLEFQFHPAASPLDKDWDKKPLRYQ